MIFACQTSVERFPKEYSFSYDLDSILSRLVYERILNPSSKLSCYEQSSDLLEPPAFELHQIYRALSVIANESDSIQAELYEAKPAAAVKRQTGSCTMTVPILFETECQEGLKQYGPRARNIARTLSSRWDFSLIEVGSPCLLYPSRQYQ